MAKAFVVTQGAYSHYHIVGVFTSREKAIEFCPVAETGKIDDASIEEWELDTLPDEDAESKLLETFTVWIRLDNGNSDWSDGFMADAEMHPRNWFHAERMEHDKTIYAQSVISLEHARKIAAECRQQWLRENSVLR